MKDFCSILPRAKKPQVVRVHFRENRVFVLCVFSKLRQVVRFTIQSTIYVYLNNTFGFDDEQRQLKVK